MTAPDRTRLSGVGIASLVSQTESSRVETQLDLEGLLDAAGTTQPMTLTFEGEPRVLDSGPLSLGHVLAGWGTGHGAEWKRACERLGLRRALAAGQCYLMASIAPEIRAEVPRLVEGLACRNRRWTAGFSWSGGVRAPDQDLPGA